MKFLYETYLCFSFSSLVFAQADTIPTFCFPMQTGNLWQYKEPPPPDEPYFTEIRTERDTTFFNGQTYGSFVTKNYGYSDTIGLVKYVRQVNNKVYRYFPNQQKEFMIYDFSKSVGDTVSIFSNPSQFGSDTSIVTVLDMGVQNIFGKPRKYVTFYNRLIQATLYWIEQITDSMGVTFSQIEPGYQLYLVGAIVDSVRYGTVTNVLLKEKEIPNDFTLFQNYPNPFNPFTEIQFNLANNSNVVVTIYDLLGKKIKNLVEGEFYPGEYKYKWDGRNNADITVSSGVYFITLRTDYYTKTIKALFLR